MLIESPISTSYRMTTVMFALYATILEIFAVGMFLTLIVTFKSVKIKSTCANWNPPTRFQFWWQLKWALPYDPICHNFRDIRSRHVCDLDLELLNGPRSNVNRKAMCDFLCLVNCSVCPICHRLPDNHVWTSNEWMNEWIYEWMNEERTNEWTYVRTNERIN